MRFATMNKRFPIELRAVVSLWLIAALCLAGKINSFQKYWTQRHHTSLPLEARLLGPDAEAQEALDGFLQKGSFAFLSRQDPNQFGGPAPTPTPTNTTAASPASPQLLALHTPPQSVVNGDAASTAGSPSPLQGLSPTVHLAVKPTPGKAPGKIDSDENDGPATAWQPHYGAEAKLALSRGDKILFAGDSLMQGLVPHLTRDLRRDGFRHYLDASRHSTGFSYPATFDWLGKIQTAIVRDRVNTVIIFIGANDAWSLASGGKLYGFGSPPWRAEYTRRVREVVQFAHQHKVRVMWLELPPMRYDNLTTGRQLLNTIYRQVATEESALFVPTAQVVNDNEDKFGLFKTLADGKVAQTRMDDGVHFTRLGQTLISKAVLQHLNLQEGHANE
jgi:hypothetical protein